MLTCLPDCNVLRSDHTRLDGDGHKMRRTMQHYFSRGGWYAAFLVDLPFTKSVTTISLRLQCGNIHDTST